MRNTERLLTPSFNASGAVHLMGNLPFSFGKCTVASVASPKSDICGLKSGHKATLAVEVVTLACPWAFNKTFLAARSLAVQETLRKGRYRSPVNEPLTRKIHHAFANIPVVVVVAGVGE